MKDTIEPPEELDLVRVRPGEDRIELAELDRTVSGDGKKRQDKTDDDEDFDFVDSVEVRPEGGFLLLDGICEKEKDYNVGELLAGCRAKLTRSCEQRQSRVELY